MGDMADLAGDQAFDAWNEGRDRSAAFVLEERVCWLCHARFAVQIDPPLDMRQPCPRCGVGDERSSEEFARFCEEANIVPPNPNDAIAVYSVASWYAEWRRTGEVPRV